MNLVGAVILFSLVFLAGIKPIFIQVQHEGATGILSKISYESLLVPQVSSLEEAEEKGFIHTGAGVVLSPIEGSIAREAGMRQGDVLLGVDRERVDSPEDVIRILTDGPDKQREFAVIRDGQLLTLSATTQ